MQFFLQDLQSEDKNIAVMLIVWWDSESGSATKVHISGMEGTVIV